jgi:diamine N-acetyltransferase
LSATDFVIRRAGPDDAARVAEVGARLFTQAFAVHNTAENLRAYLDSAFNETKQREEIADPANIVWIAESPDARAVGYAQVKLGSRTKELNADKSAELCRIYADSDFHGRGLGTALMATCVDAATQWGASHLWLGVFQKNPRAIAFYQKHGFRIVGEQIFTVGSDPQRDWVMVRDLSR